MGRAKVFTLLKSKPDALHHSKAKGYQHTEKHYFKSAVIFTRIRLNFFEIKSSIVTYGIGEVTKRCCH